MDAQQILDSARLPANVRIFRVKVSLPSGNTAVYDIEARHIDSHRADFRCSDSDRNHQRALLWGRHIATLLPGDDGWQWFHPKTHECSPRSKYSDTPSLSDLGEALGDL